MAAGIMNYINTPWLQKGIGSINLQGKFREKWNADEISELENMFGPGATGQPSDARHMSAMSNLSDWLAGLWGAKASETSPSKMAQFLGDTGAFGAGLINEIPAVYHSIRGKAPWRDIGEDIVANWRGTYGTPHGKTSKDIFREVYSGGQSEKQAIPLPNTPPPGWTPAPRADRDFTQTKYGKSYYGGGIASLNGGGTIHRDSRTPLPDDLMDQMYDWILQQMMKQRQEEMQEQWERDRNPMLYPPPIPEGGMEV